MVCFCFFQHGENNRTFELSAFGPNVHFCGAHLSIFADKSSRIPMTRKCPLLIFVFFCFSSLSAQDSTRYFINLDSISGNSLKVRVLPGSDAIARFRDTVDFLFAATVPGTYAQLDYGRFIKNFAAFDADGKQLRWLPSGKNKFRILGKPSEISYLVFDSYHSPKMKPKIFEPAGTNIQKDRNVILNNAGFFGFFRGLEALPLQLVVQKPTFFYGISSLPSITEDRVQRFSAKDYHALADGPIMFCKPDTSSFRVSNCLVRVGVFAESGREVSAQIVNEIKVSLMALAGFFDQQLPVNEYNFIIYLRDYSDLGDIVSGKERGFFKILRAGIKMAGQGFGALEHGTSSLYFLPDFGTDLTYKSVKEVAVHEFLHIVTPLNLHSQHIGAFDYEKPEMCEHLWLYEGITEYFKGLALEQAGVMSPWSYLSKELRGKIASGAKYPFTKMSFTEMSKNVLREPYKKQYLQVYERGAMLGALLDIELISLTGGMKSLKDVVFALSKKYGKDRSFMEKEFVEEFIGASHPGIRPFFDRYIYGKDTLPVAQILQKAGIRYNANFKGLIPQSPIKNVKLEMLIINQQRKVKKVKKGDQAGFQKDDLINFEKVRFGAMHTPYGFRNEGEMVRIPVSRNGKETELSVPNKMIPGEMKHLIFIEKDMTEDQKMVFNRWLKQ
jgi:predicted metalloprotease with PDZ domain